MCSHSTGHMFCPNNNIYEDIGQNHCLYFSFGKAFNFITVEESRSSGTKGENSVPYPTLFSMRGGFLCSKQCVSLGLKCTQMNL